MPGEDCTGCPERGSGVRERETRRSGEVARWRGVGTRCEISYARGLDPYE